MVQRIVEMGSLANFSIHAKIRAAHGPLVPPLLHATSLLIDALPTSCVNLENDILSDVTYSAYAHPGKPSTK